MPGADKYGQAPLSITLQGRRLPVLRSGGVPARRQVVLKSRKLRIAALAANRSELAGGPRFNLYMLGAFAAIALVLAVTGVYAMLSFAVAERRREMAVRLALGAGGSRIARLVLRNGLTLTIEGVAAGTAAALASTRVLSSLLYGVEPTDPLTFAAAASFLVLAALMACYLPARQAAQLDAITVFRE